MAEYRVYLLDHLGHITERVDLVFDRDEEAVAATRKRFPIEAIELWQGDRMVRDFSNGHAAGDAFRQITADRISPCAPLPAGIIAARGNQRP
jgi:hypothetical protein